jgi:hypothetical protein
MDQSGSKKRFMKVHRENEIGHSFRDNIQRRHALQIVTDTLFDAFVSERHGLMQMTKQAAIVKYRVRPSRMNEFLSLLRAHIGRTKVTEPGCVQFDLLMPHRQADTVHLYEVYAGPMPSIFTTRRKPLQTTRLSQSRFCWSDR